MSRASKKPQSQRLPARVAQTFAEFFALEVSGAIVLLAAAVAALFLANTPAFEPVERFWHLALLPHLGSWRLPGTPREIIDDGLMALFFFVVGLEIKREIVCGELSSRRRAALPVLAAIGGMVVPALIFFALNAGGPGARGWGVPMATDIAFALGVLALLGSRVPTGLKVSLTALAIADDIGAVAVIALFYTPHLAWGWLGVGFALLGGLVVLNLMRQQSPWPYLVLGVLVWFAFLNSGVHATIAGVLVAFTIPHDKLLPRLEHALLPWTTYIVLPLFAFANAGVHLAGFQLPAALLRPVPLGILLGLLVGKPLGIMLASAIGVRLRAAELPEGVCWPQMVGAGVVAGIGFTVALFVATLAFRDPATLAEAKLAILATSVLAGGAGYALLRGVSRPVGER